MSLFPIILVRTVFPDVEHQHDDHDDVMGESHWTGALSRLLDFATNLYPLPSRTNASESDLS